MTAINEFVNGADLECLISLDPNWETSWSAAMLEQSLVANCRILKLSEDGVDLGYCLFRVIGKEVEILNIVVRPKSRSQGWAQKLLGFLIGMLPADSSIFLEVRQSNQIAQHVYKKLGFSQVGVRKDYYKSNQPDNLECRENGLIFRR